METLDIDVFGQPSVNGETISKFKREWLIIIFLALHEATEDEDIEITRGFLQKNLWKAESDNTKFAEQVTQEFEAPTQQKQAAKPANLTNALSNIRHKIADVIHENPNGTLSLKHTGSLRISKVANFVEACDNEDVFKALKLYKSFLQGFDYLIDGAANKYIFKWVVRERNRYKGMLLSCAFFRSMTMPFSIPAIWDALIDAVAGIEALWQMEPSGNILILEDALSDDIAVMRDSLGDEEDIHALTKFEFFKRVYYFLVLADSKHQTSFLEILNEELQMIYPDFVMARADKDEAKDYLGFLPETIISSSEATSSTPYQGLAPFSENTAKYYYGREREVQTLANFLFAQPKFVAVIGQSGSGKSSLVRAGLLPLLSEGDNAQGEYWQCLVTRPGSNPLTEFQRALRKLSIAEETIIDGLSTWQKHSAPKKKFLWVIDQFEELFTNNVSAEKVDNFIAEITKLVLHNTEANRLLPYSLSILIILRHDFISSFERCTTELRTGLKQLGYDFRFDDTVGLSTHIEEDGLLTAIQAPLQQANQDVHFAQDLVETIVRDIADRAYENKHYRKAAKVTDLPLLQITLLRLWEKRDESNNITHEAYQQIGGVTGALTEWGDALLDKYREDIEDIKKLLIYLVHIGNNTMGVIDVRRKQSLYQLQRYNFAGDITALVHKLSTEERLLVVTEHGNTTTVELIHDALISRWKRLQAWVQENYAFRIWYQGFSQRRDLWEQAVYENRGESDKRVLTLADLDEAVHYSTTSSYHSWFNEADLWYVERSQYIDEQEKKNKQELSDGKQMGELLGRVRDSLTLPSKHHIQEAVLFALEAFHCQHTPESYELLQKSLGLLAKPIISLGSVTTCAFHPEASEIAVAIEEYIYFWSLTKQQFVRKLTCQANMLSYIQEGNLLTAYHTSKDTLILFDTKTNQEVLSLNDVSLFACSQDGKILATEQLGEISSHVKLWSLEQYNCIETGQVYDNIRTMAFRQKTGQLIIIAENQGMHLWTSNMKRKSLSSKVNSWSKQRHYIVGQENTIFNAWLSPDGETLVLKSAEYHDGLVVRQVNNLSTRISIATSSQRISFNEDSNYLIITEPTSIRFWHIPSQKEVKTIKSEGRTTAYLQGDIVVARGGPGSHQLQLFDMATNKEFLRFPQEEATLSPDANWLITQNGYDLTYLFDITERTHHKMASNLHDPSEFLAFSADDKSLVSINPHGEFAVWNPASGECVFETHMSLFKVRHMFVGNNNDCMMLSTAGEDSYLIMYNWETGEDFYQQIFPEIKQPTQQISDALEKLLWESNPLSNEMVPSQESKIQADEHTLLPYEAKGLATPMHQNIASNIREMRFSVTQELWAYSDVNVSKIFVTNTEDEIVLAIPFFKKVYDVALSPHNKWLAFSRASENPERKFVEIWDIAKREKLISCFTADGPYTQLFFSEDETKLLMNSEIDGVFFIALPSFAQVENWRNVYLEEKSHTMALHYKGLFVGENEKTSWMLVQEETLETIVLGYIFATWRHKVLTLDAQAKYFLSSKEEQLAVWDLEAENGIEQIGEINHSANITSSALSADKRVVAIGDARGGVYSWHWQPADLITKACEYVTLERMMPGWRFREEYFANDEYELVSERYYSLQPFPAEVVLGELLLEQANYKIYAPREENLVRPYVYVVSDNCLAKYWLEPKVALAFNRGLHPKELGELKGILKRL